MRRHPRVFVAVAIAGALVFAACGSKSSPAASHTTSPPSGTGTTVHVAIPASSTPSVSAKMICGSEVQDDMASLLGVRTSEPLKPTWIDHIYSCTYIYPNGSITLSVKELTNKPDTDAYFAAEAKKLGKTQNINGLGQGAFTTSNDSAVVRKDYKLLLVDISKLPKNFGNPPDTRGDIALNVAATIMGCWTGA